MWLGLMLVVLGFFGHYFAAQAIGSTHIAYRDHMLGFVLILVVTGGIIALLGRRFWRARPDLTVLIIGVVQAIFGIYIYLNPPA